MKKLSKEQIKKLRWETGPYSEVNIKIEDRLLDNYSSRQFVSVYANINPLTYEICNQNIGSFDSEIQWLLMSARYYDQWHGYIVTNFVEQVDYDDIKVIISVLEKAQKAKERLTDNIIQLHYFVMDLLDIDYKDVG